MSAAGFWREAIIALLISAAAAIGFEFARPLLGSADALRLSLLGAATAYVLLRLIRASGRSGRLLAASVWAVLAGGLLLFNPSLAVWLLLPTIAIWLLRTLFNYSRLLPALADAGISGFAIAAAVVSLGHTHSLFLALWSYFLIQALHVFLPAAPSASNNLDTDPFDAAARQAEAALRRLSVRH